MNPRAILYGSAFTGIALLSLLDAAAKGVVIFLIAIVLALAMRRASAASRHLVWLCALCAALALPFCASLLPQLRVLPGWMRWEEIPRRFTAVEPIALSVLENGVASPDAEATAVQQSITAPTGKAALRSSTPAARKLHRISASAIVFGWACGAALLLSPLCYSLLALHSLKRRARLIVEGPLAIACREIEHELGIARPVKIFIGAPDAMPMVWGIFHGNLLLPATANDWPAARTRAVLLHELAHVRRRDPLSQFIAHIALAVHWFNPLAWFAVRQLRAEQERAADDLVLRHGVRASEYASDLLAVAKGFHAAPFAHVALTMARPAHLENRIAGILDAARNRRALTRWIACCAILLAGVIAVPLAMLRADDTPKMRGRILDRNGIVLAQNKDAVTREYPFRALAAHTLGYTGREGKDGPRVGRSGAEKVFDARLSKGEDVALTLDARLQSAVQNVLREADIGRGSVVMLDPKSGDVLASASFPNFDGNSFAPAISAENWRALIDNPAAPLLDRTVQTSAPGAVYKLVTALAAAAAGKVDRTFDCNGGVEYGGRLLRCWIAMQGGQHGRLDLHDAITQSCNCYFYQLGNEVGIDELEKTARALGLGARSGLDIPGEQTGVVSSPALLAEGEKWTRGHTANAAIGQGYTLATPLQMASVAATIANDGRALLPRLSADGAPLLRHDFIAAGCKPEQVAQLRAAMRDTVMLDGGTGKKARSEMIAIAGKTGTSQTMRSESGSRVPESCAWFIGYAPADSPRYAFAISVEGGKAGGAVCAPIARRILEAVAAGLPEPTAQTPADGHFRKIDSVE